VTRLLDTNILVRHVTGEPPEQARRATASLRTAAPKELVLVDLIAAEFVFVLQSVYRQPRASVATLLRSLLALPAVRCDGELRLYRSLDLYEAGMDFPDAYLVATAELGGISEILSFDRGFRHVPGVRRVEP
jgi:predicted nucleic acid-binding protein